MLEKGVPTLHFMKTGIELYDIISYSNTGTCYFAPRYIDNLYYLERNLS